MGFLRGAAAGFAATIPMTVVMEVMRAWLPREQFRRMPPREIVDRTVAKIGEAAQIDQGDRIVITTAAHLAFGAAAGGLYGALIGPRRSSTLTGIGYGLIVWVTCVRCRTPVARRPSCRHRRHEGSKRSAHRFACCVGRHSGSAIAAILRSRITRSPHDLFQCLLHFSR